MTIEMFIIQCIITISLSILGWIIGNNNYIKRRKEKFEDAIQKYAITAPAISNSNIYQNFSLMYNSWKTTERLNWLKTNNIIELTAFYKWIAEKFEDSGQKMSWHDFWKNQIK